MAKRHGRPSPHYRYEHYDPASELVDHEILRELLPLEAHPRGQQPCHGALSVMPSGGWSMPLVDTQRRRLCLRWRCCVAV